jgi:segregation and condensation protein B
LFASTKQFLDDLGLTSLDQLPPLQQMAKGEVQGDTLLELQALEGTLPGGVEQAAIDFAEEVAAESERKTPDGNSLEQKLSAGELVEGPSRQHSAEENNFQDPTVAGSILESATEIETSQSNQ